MSALGEPPESWLGTLLRSFGYFLVGVFLGLLPAVLCLAVMSAPGRHVVWTVPVYMVVASGLLSCLLGVLSGGRFLGWLLRVLGRNVEPPL